MLLYASGMKTLTSLFGSLFGLLVLLGSISVAHAKAVTLSEQDVKVVVSSHNQKIQACYTRLGMRSQKATGNMMLAFVVDRQGNTADVRINAPGVRGKKLGRCVARVVKKWRFPSSGSATEIHFPYRFHFSRGHGPQRR